MEGRYNFYWNEHQQYGFNSTGGIPLAANGSYTLPTRNTGDKIHFYGWYDAAETAVSGPSIKYDYRDVFASAGYELSRWWTYASLTLPTGKVLTFPFYEVVIGADNVVELCGAN